MTEAIGVRHSAPQPRTSFAFPLPVGALFIRCSDSPAAARVAAPRGISFEPMKSSMFADLHLTAEFQNSRRVNGPGAEAVVCAEPHVAVAMLLDGSVIGAGGIIQIWRGRAEAWLLPSVRMKPRHFVMALRRCLDELQRAESAGVRRMECTILSGHQQRVRVVERLGFTRESTMRSYGPGGEDHDMFTRVAPSCLVSYFDAETVK